MVKLEGAPVKAPAAELQQKADPFASATVGGDRATFELAKNPARNPTMADLTRIGNQVNQQMASQGIGGRGWTGNLEDKNKCGEVNFQAAEALRQKLAQAGFTNVRVGQANSENGNMLMGNGMHSVAVAYDPASGKGVIVDAWQNPRRVVPVTVQVNGNSGMSSEVTVNFPRGTGGHRANGYHGTVIDVNLKRD